MTEKKPIVSFQGAIGSYSDIAAKNYFSLEMTPLPCHTFYEAVRAVTDQSADLAILPIENSSSGCITHTYDLLLEQKVEIVGEYILPIHHCLIGKAESVFDTVTEVLSHPVALHQCEKYLRRFSNIKITPTFDTAGSVAMIARQKSAFKVAIAGPEAALHYRLKILRDKIQDYPDNQTRFVVIAPAKYQESQCLDETTYKTSIVFDTQDKPGTLQEILGIFKKKKINLSALHSRPIKARVWQYLFFADLAGHRRHETVAAALLLIKQKTHFVKILGSFRKH